MASTAGLPANRYSGTSAGGASQQNAPPLRLSILDRLLDEDAPLLQTLRHGIRRDLEALLNTEQRVVGWSEELDQLDRSILNFGMMCLGTTNMATEEARLAVVERIGAFIRFWEPRLRNLNIRALPNVDASDRSLRIRIEAQIAVDPTPVPMVFDTVIEPSGNTMVSLASARSE